RVSAPLRGAFAAPHPGRPVRLVGELLWPERSAAEYAACVQHEGLVNRALAGRCADMLCPYDAARLTPAAVAAVPPPHPVLVDGPGGRPSARYSPDDAVAAGNQPLAAPPGAEPFTV